MLPDNYVNNPYASPPLLWDSDFRLGTVQLSQWIALFLLDLTSVLLNNQMQLLLLVGVVVYLAVCSISYKMALVKGHFVFSFSYHFLQ